jgi:hypothetical protein
VFGARKWYTTTSFTKDDLYNTEKFPWRTAISLENRDLDKGETPVLMVFSSTDETGIAVKPVYVNYWARQVATVQQRAEVINKTCDANSMAPYA